MQPTIPGTILPLPLPKKSKLSTFLSPTPGLLPLEPSPRKSSNAKSRRRRERNMSSMDQVLGNPANSNALLDLGIVAPLDPSLIVPKKNRKTKGRKKGRRKSMAELMADPSNNAALTELGIPTPLPVATPLPLPVPIQTSGKDSGGGRRRRRRERNMSSMDQVLGNPANSNGKYSKRRCEQCSCNNLQNSLYYFIPFLLSSLES